MFTEQRIISAPSKGVFAALAIFVLGLAVGAALSPVTMSRSQTGAPQPLRTTSSGAPVAFSGAPVALRSGYPAEVLRVVDAPELKAHCDEERAKAAAARDALQAILDQGSVGVSAVTLDKYGGRVVADVSTRATPDVSAALLGANLARPYSGGRRESWCG